MVCLCVCQQTTASCRMWDGHWSVCLSVNCTLQDVGCGLSVCQQTTASCRMWYGHWSVCLSVNCILQDVGCGLSVCQQTTAGCGMGFGLSANHCILQDVRWALVCLSMSSHSLESGRLMFLSRAGRPQWPVVTWNTLVWKPRQGLTSTVWPVVTR